MALNEALLSSSLVRKKNIRKEFCYLFYFLTKFLSYVFFSHFQNIKINNFFLGEAV